MAVRRFRGGVRTGPRRKMLWMSSAVATDEIALAANTTALVSTLNAAALALRPFTVVRIRGILWVSADTTVASERPFGAYGLITVSDQAASVGATAVPRPYSQSSNEWILWQPWLASILRGDAVGFTTDNFRPYVFDSKAQRKVSQGEDLATVIENNNASHGVNFVESLRVLIKTN